VLFDEIDGLVEAIGVVLDAPGENPTDGHTVAVQGLEHTHSALDRMVIR